MPLMILARSGTPSSNGEGLSTRRESHQDNAYQLTFDPNLLGPTVQNVGSFTGGQCDFGDSSPGVSYCSPFWPKAWSAAGVNYFNPFIEPDKTSRDTQKVNFFRGNAGLRGNVGLGDWRYDANFQVSRTIQRGRGQSEYEPSYQLIDRCGGSIWNAKQFNCDGSPGATGSRRRAHLRKQSHQWCIQWRKLRAAELL